MGIFYISIFFPLKIWNFTQASQTLTNCFFCIKLFWEVNQPYTVSSIWSLEDSLHLSLIVLCIIVSWKSGDYGLFSLRKFSLWAGQTLPNKQPLRAVLVLHSLWPHLLHIIQPVLWILNYWIPCGLFMAFTAIISEQFANTSLHYKMKGTVLFLFHREEGELEHKN